VRGPPGWLRHLVGGRRPSGTGWPCCAAGVCSSRRRARFVQQRLGEAGGDGEVRSPLRRGHAGDDVSGRGLEPVELLADNFGVVPIHGVGKCVWFVLGDPSGPVANDGWGLPELQRRSRRCFLVIFRSCSTPFCTSAKRSCGSTPIQRGHPSPLIKARRRVPNLSTGNEDRRRGRPERDDADVLRTIRLQTRQRKAPSYC
jgi:hypothetical protein